MTCVSGVPGATGDAVSGRGLPGGDGGLAVDLARQDGDHLLEGGDAVAGAEGGVDALAGGLARVVSELTRANDV